LKNGSPMIGVDDSNNGRSNPLSSWSAHLG
jgi:hypothetical protein